MTYDILTKIREISQAGDKKAASFIEEFDLAIKSNNIANLLRMEKELLDKAFESFEFIGPIEHRLLGRLKEDRNLCAHPTFSSEAELFQPSVELVRLHIVTAIEKLLALSPIQGKALFDSFSVDIVSAAFPQEREKAIEHVGHRYLDRLRENLVKNFAMILFKGYLHDKPIQWANYKDRLLYSLAAIARFRQRIWNDAVRPDVIKLLDSLSAEQLPQFFSLLKEFPDLWLHLKPGAEHRLAAVVKNFNPSNPDNTIFAAAGLDRFKNIICEAFDLLDSERKLKVIANYPNPVFLTAGLKLLRSAWGFRYAERVFYGAVMPFAKIFQTNDIRNLAEIVKNNHQVWDAEEIPKLLAEFINQVPKDINFEEPYWMELKKNLDFQNRVDHFEPVWAALAQRDILLE